MLAEAITFDEPGVVSVREVDIPSPGPGEVLIRTAFSGVSPGTELRSLAGAQAGTSEWPFIPGYSLAGVVVEAGEGVEIPRGATVFAAGTQRSSVARMWGGHVGYAVVAENRVYRAQPDTDLAALSLTHLAAIAHHGVRMAELIEGDRVAVIGLGPIGQLSARIFSIAMRGWGGEVRAYDLRESRVAVAREAGIDAFTEAPEPGWADVVVDATGSMRSLPSVIAAGRDKSWTEAGIDGVRILIQGSYPGTIDIPYEEVFAKQARLLFPRSADRTDIGSVIQMLEQGELSMRGLSEAFAVKEAPEVYASLASGDRLSAVFRWH
jgi:2-desacetyl-2-hydroxyethyl bacteriochlorophyllide A dehydrogenase